MNSLKTRLYLLATIIFLYWFSLYAYVPILPAYAASLGSSYKMVGLIVGSYGFTQLLLRIPLGIASDTLNNRKIFIIAGLFTSIISSLGMWFFPNSTALLIFRALSGATAATWVAYTILFSSYFPSHETTKAIGIINAINYSGQMIAMFLGGITAQKAGQEYSFLLSAASGIIAAILSFYISDNKVDRKPLKLTELLETTKDTNLIIVSSLAVLAQLVTYATVFGFTPVAAKNIGANSLELGFLATLTILPTIFSSAMSGGFFTKKIGETNTIVLGFAITAASCTVIPLITSITWLYISQLIGGFGRGLAFSPLMALSIKNVASNKRATAMGFFQAIYGLGMFIGPVMVGVLSEQTGLKWGFWATGIISIIGALTAAYSLRTSHRPKPDSQL